MNLYSVTHPHPHPHPHPHTHTHTHKYIYIYIYKYTKLYLVNRAEWTALEDWYDITYPDSDGIPKTCSGEATPV